MPTRPALPRSLTSVLELGQRLGAAVLQRDAALRLQLSCLLVRHLGHISMLLVQCLDHTRPRGTRITVTHDGHAIGALAALDGLMLDLLGLLGCGLCTVKGAVVLEWCKATA